MKVKEGGIWDQFYTFPGQCKCANTDICSYIQGIMRGILFFLLVIFFGVGAVLIVLEPYIVLVLSIWTGELIGFFGDNLALFGISSAVQSGVLIFILLQYLGRSVKGRVNWVVPSVVSVGYKAFKEKTCFLIERV